MRVQDAFNDLNSSKSAHGAVCDQSLRCIKPFLIYLPNSHDKISHWDGSRWLSEPKAHVAWFVIVINKSECSLSSYTYKTESVKLAISVIENHDHAWYKCSQSKLDVVSFQKSKQNNCYKTVVIITIHSNNQWGKRLVECKYIKKTETVSWESHGNSKATAIEAENFLSDHDGLYL